MEFLYIGIGTLFIIVAGVFLIKKALEERDGKGSLKYTYRRRQHYLTPTEHKCYKALVQAVGNDYFVFAQVHLSSILEHEVRGQNWKGAFAHINQKSVDFVLCDKQYISPKLAIELDGKSHEREERKRRDKEVERMLEEAEMPLLRIENRNGFAADELAEKIESALS